MVNQDDKDGAALDKLTMRLWYRRRMTKINKLLSLLVAGKTIEEAAAEVGLSLGDAIQLKEAHFL